jgi:hypothetical protein
VFTGTRGRQLAGRCELIFTGAFPYREEWAQLIVALEATSWLHHHEPGTLAAQARYLHQRTGGMIGSLTHLIRGAAIAPPPVAARGHRHQRRHPRHLPGPPRRNLDPGHRQRLRQLAPGTWNQALAGVSPGRQVDGPGHPVVEIAIYPDVVWLAARSLREHSASHRAVS